MQSSLRPTAEQNCFCLLVVMVLPRGVEGGWGNSLEGNRVKKINNSKNSFSFSPTPPKFALMPVYPSCGNGLPYHSAN